MSTPISPSVAKVLDKDRGTHCVDEDILLADLEEDTSILDAFREKRVQQLHEELEKARYMRNQNHGIYQEIANEKEAMDIVTETKYAILHFAHSGFRRCEIMDSHMHRLASKHYEARFIKLDVETAPFLVSKLGVKILPCVIGFLNGNGVGRIEGFGVLGNTDSFNSIVLERLLVGFKVLVRGKLENAESAANVDDSCQKVISTTDDDDWD